MQLLIVTAQRRDEVAHLAWPDLDLEQGLWTLPRELTKADRVHDVPLSDLAIAIIAGLPRFGDGWLFPANRAGSTLPLSGFSKFKRKLDALIAKRRAAAAGGDPEADGFELGPWYLPAWRLHDLRRTAASGMARLGHPPHVVAAILNHSPGATQGVTAIYNRYRYSDERRRALEAWARELERIIGRDKRKVIPGPWGAS